MSGLFSRTPLLQALIGLFELPEDDSIPDDEHFIDIEDTPGYQTAFSQLAFAGKKEHDPIGEAVGNPKILLAQSLHKLSTACPGRVSQVWGCIGLGDGASSLFDSIFFVFIFFKFKIQVSCITWMNEHALLGLMQSPIKKKHYHQR